MKGHVDLKEYNVTAKKQFLIKIHYSYMPFYTYTSLVEVPNVV